MEFPGKEWQHSPPEALGVSARKLGEAVAFFATLPVGDGVSELFIVRRGRVIHAGPRVDHAHGIWSCTKSFTSTALGLLADDGKCSPDDRAARWAPELAETYAEVTLRHFATMTSGYRALGDEPRNGYRHGPSETPFLPDPQPLFAPPGSQYAYWDSAMNEFAWVLTRIAGQSLEALFRARIAEPIGMDPAEWRWGCFTLDDGTPVNGGAGNGNKHVFISARQIARFGHLMLNEGGWAGRQLLSRAWVQRATQPQAPAALPDVHPDSAADGRGTYGLNWWCNGNRPNGERKWPGVPDGAFSASGYNNNDVFIVPSWEMVIVRLGLDERDHAISDDEHARFLRLIGDAIVD